MSESVGVRELCQNLSRYLDRVKAGESLEVTERGRIVARLSPSGPDGGGGYAELAARFGATMPKGNLAETIAALGDRPSSPAGTTDAILSEGRSDRLG